MHLSIQEILTTIAHAALRFEILGWLACCQGTPLYQKTESGRVIRMQIGSRLTTRTWYFLVRRAKLTIDLTNCAV